MRHSFSLSQIKSRSEVYFKRLSKISAGWRRQASSSNKFFRQHNQFHEKGKASQNPEFWRCSTLHSAHCTLATPFHCEKSGFCSLVQTTMTETSRESRHPVKNVGEPLDSGVKDVLVFSPQSFWCSTARLPLPGSASYLSDDLIVSFSTACQCDVD